MDREIPQDIRSRRKLKTVATAVIASLALLFLVAASLEWLRPSVAKNELTTARVEQGAVDASLEASGTVLPAGEQVISSPVEARVIRIARRAGDKVRPGDEIVALDTAAARLELDRLGNAATQQENSLAELRLTLEEKVAGIRSAIEQKQLDVEILRLRAQQNGTLHREGLLASHDDLAAKTAARKAEIELAGLRAALQRAERSAAAQIAGSSSTLAMSRRQRDEAGRQLELAMMRAEQNGVITWIIPDSGVTVRRGDPVARLADLSAFRVVATLSDAYASRLSVGQAVRIDLDDATPITGTIASVDPRMEGGAIRFNINLDQPSHAALRSNARVDVRVMTGSRKAALRVRRGALAQNAAEDVFVVRGRELVAVPVRWGLTGSDYVEVSSGLRPGDEVVISPMREYQDVKKVRLR